MSLFSNPTEHAANPPESWEVIKVYAGAWDLRAGEATINRYPTRKQAVADRESGFYVSLYHKEDRWYRGEPVSGWKPYTP